MRRITIFLLAAAVVACDTTAGPDLSPGTLTDLLSVEYGDGRFVAVGTRFHLLGEHYRAGSDSVLILTSDDGVAWSQARFGPRGSLSSVARGTGLWLAVGPGLVEGPLGAVFTSSDGETWSEGTIPPYRWRSVTFGEGVFVASGHDPAASQAVVATSPDGESWTEVARTSLFGARVSYGGGRFVLYGEDGRVVVSDDAASWEVVELPDLTWIPVLRHLDGEWLGLGLHDCCAGEDPGGITYFAVRSADGVTWTTDELAQAEFMEGLAVGPAAYVGVGGGRIQRATAPATAWETVTTTTSDRLPFDVVHGDGRFVVVGRHATWTSTDGSSWVDRDLPALTVTP